MNRARLQVLLVAEHRQLELGAPLLAAVHVPAASPVETAGQGVGRRPQDRPAVAGFTHRRLREREHAARDAVAPPVRVDVQMRDVADAGDLSPFLPVLPSRPPGGERHEIIVAADGHPRPALGLAQAQIPLRLRALEARRLPEPRREFSICGVSAHHERGHRRRVLVGRLPQCEVARHGGHRPEAAASASSTAWAASSTTSIPGPPSMSPGPVTAQLRSAATRLPSRRAKPISASVPHSPPIATTASADATTARLRPWPIPVATTWVMKGFASPVLSPGTIPITSPPASRAPREAPSITPPMPPHTTTAPLMAMSCPTSSASGWSSSSGVPLPITAICGRRVTDFPRSLSPACR